MIGQRITFDGHRLNDLFFVGDVDVGLPEYSPQTEDRTAMDGAVVTGSRLGSVRIAMELVAKPGHGRSVRSVMSELLSWLDVDGPRVLALSEEEGLWRLAIPTGTPTVGDIDYNDRVTVEFLQPDPALYGSKRSVSVPSGGSVAFVVMGDYPTTPTIAGASVYRNSSTRQWGVRLDGGDFLCAEVPVSSASRVSFDCTARRCLVNGATTVPTLTSDWFALSPGRHEVSNHQGTGACTVEWVERWHR